MYWCALRIGVGIVLRGGEVLVVEFGGVVITILWIRRGQRERRSGRRLLWHGSGFMSWVRMWRGRIKCSASSRCREIVVVGVHARGGEDRTLMFELGTFGFWAEFLQDAVLQAVLL